MRAFARALLLSTALALTCAAPHGYAQAQRAPTDEATRLKREGDDAFLALRYADALRAWDASLAAAPNPALHYNRGRALEALERIPEAIDAYERFLLEAPADLRERTAKLGEHVKTLRQKIATVDLRVSPAGARVMVRKVVVGTAPLRTRLRLNAGPLDVDAFADGYEPAHLELVLRGGTTQTIDVALRARQGVLALGSQPEGATFYVDGKVVPSVSDVAPGEHVVRAERGAAQSERNVTVRNGERIELTFDLEQTGNPSLLSRWWFWVGAGALAAGGVAAVVLLTRPAEARSGDIGPGQLTAPLLRF